jgi:hypothetical protein
MKLNSGKSIICDGHDQAGRTTNNVNIWMTAVSQFEMGLSKQPSVAINLDVMSLVWKFQQDELKGTTQALNPS